MQRNVVICKGEKRGAWRKTEMADHHTPESHKQHRSGTIWRTLHSSSSVSHYAWLPPTPTPGQSSLLPFFELIRISFSSLNVPFFLQDVTCPLSPFGWGPIIPPPPPSADIPQPKTIHSSLHSPVPATLIQSRSLSQLCTWAHLNSDMIYFTISFVNVRIGGIFVLFLVYWLS